MVWITLEKHQYEYIKEILSWSSLGIQLQEELDTWLPVVEVMADSFPEGHHFEYDYGVYCEKRILAKRLHPLISLSQNYAILFHMDARSHGPDIWESHILFKDNEVYHFVKHDASFEEMECAIRDSALSLSFGVIVADETVASFARRSDVGQAQIEIWAKNTTHIIVGICDWTTYLIWPNLNPNESCHR